MTLLESRAGTGWGDNAVARLVGSLDHDAGEELRARLLDILNQGHRTVVIDVSDLAWVDPAGLAALRRAVSQLRARGARTYVRGTAPLVEQAFADAGVLNDVVIL